MKLIFFYAIVRNIFNNLTLSSTAHLSYYCSYEHEWFYITFLCCFFILCICYNLRIPNERRLTVLAIQSLEMKYCVSLKVRNESISTI